MAESKLISRIHSILKDLEGYKQLSFIRNNTGTARRGKCYFRFGKDGSADFIIFCKKGITVFVECKDPEGIQSEKQIAFQQLVEILNFKYYLISSYKDFQELIFENCNLPI